jgi:hypothetical protein
MTKAQNKSDDGTITPAASTSSEAEGSKRQQTCGLVMPISAIDGCSEAHWLEVRDILSDSIKSAGFDAQLVSEADDVGVIQKRIIQNLYDNPIVVCDVSGKNANVMFELGIRLAFDKPTVIVKDDKTAYSFDTAPVEHLSYPRDLRFKQIVAFKEQLATKIRGTTRSASDPNYTTFLKQFGTFNVARLDTKEVSSDVYILEELRALRTDLRNLRSAPMQPPTLMADSSRPRMSGTTFIIRPPKDVDIETVVAEKLIPSLGSSSVTWSIDRLGDNLFRLSVDSAPPVDTETLQILLKRANLAPETF